MRNTVKTYLLQGQISYHLGEKKREKDLKRAKRRQYAGEFERCEQWGLCGRKFKGQFGYILSKKGMKLSPELSVHL
jgi:hypothetical protein